MGESFDIGKDHVSGLEGVKLRKASDCHNPND